jgi:hypothetical protein
LAPYPGDRSRAALCRRGPGRFSIGSLARFRAGPSLDIPAMLALFDIHVALSIASWVLGSLFMAAAAALGLSSRVLPTWLCVAAALAA